MWNWLLWQFSEYTFPLTSFLLFTSRRAHNNHFAHWMFESTSWWSGKINKVYMYWQTCKIHQFYDEHGHNKQLYGTTDIWDIQTEQIGCWAVTQYKKKHCTSKAWQFHIASFSLLSRITKWPTETDLPFLQNLSENPVSLPYLCQLLERQFVLQSKLLGLR
jgi:hypothetical protein